MSDPAQNDPNPTKTIIINLNEVGGTEQQLQPVLDRIDQVEAMITNLEVLMNLIITKGNIIVADLSALQAAVSENTDVAASVEALVQHLADQITAAATDQAALDGLVAQLRANSSGIAASVVANTPAAPDVPPTDVPPTDVPPTG